MSRLSWQGRDCRKESSSTRMASNVDTAPTILNLAGIPPPADAEGHSLLPLIQGKVKSINKYVYGEEDVMAPLRSVRTDQYKLIENLWTGKIQLFDLAHDPGEEHDLSGHEPAVQAELLHHLHEWMVKNHASVASACRSGRDMRGDPSGEGNRRRMIRPLGGHMLITGGGWHRDESPAAGRLRRWMSVDRGW